MLCNHLLTCLPTLLAYLLTCLKDLSRISQRAFPFEIRGVSVMRREGRKPISLDFKSFTIWGEGGWRGGGCQPEELWWIVLGVHFR